MRPGALAVPTALYTFKKTSKTSMENGDINKISMVDNLSICCIIWFEIFHNLKLFITFSVG